MATDSLALTRSGEASESGAAPPQIHNVYPRVWTARTKALRNRIGAKLNRIGLEHTDFTVISNDCWGQSLYEEWGLPCRTPLVGSGMRADCFVRFLADIPGHLNSRLRFIQNSRYASVNRLRTRRKPWPIASIGNDVEIHFMHFHSEEDSRRVWEEGCRQVNLNRLVVKFTIDKDGATPEHLAQFNQMRFHRKLLISEHSHPEVNNAIQVPNYILNGAMMFRRSLPYFDCAHWLNTGEVRRHSPRVLVNKLLYLRGV